jgi:2-oxo-4-hydroxy-4-carboxy-5-ureidoimidazoline decarboxylase
MTLPELNESSRENFVDAIGWVFEHSPWVAERAWRKRPFTSFDDLSTRMIQEVQSASPDEQLALLCAHPDLGAKAKVSAVLRPSRRARAWINSLRPSTMTSAI